jgi:hypothetical protein
MNLNDLRCKLITAARAHPPSDAVPFRFERRITANIKGLGIVDHWALWARALWRAAAPCIAVTILLGVWSLVTTPGKSSSTDLSQDLENTVLAAADVEQPAAETLR